MNQEWLTKAQDLSEFEEITALFGGEEKLLGIFDIGTDLMGNIHKVGLSEWVLVVIKHFRERYGKDKGDFVIKKVISSSIINNKTIH